MTGRAIHTRVWHRIRYGHWPNVTLTDTGECLFCSMEWNAERNYWEVR